MSEKKKKSSSSKDKEKDKSATKEKKSKSSKKTSEEPTETVATSSAGGAMIGQPGSVDFEAGIIFNKLVDFMTHSIIVLLFDVLDMILMGLE